MANSVERQSSEVWGNVDAGTDAAGLADYLGRMSALGSVQAFKHRAYAALGVTEGARVLDVGCGVGGDVRAIAELVGKTGRVVGLDFSEGFVAEARRQSGDHPMVEYRQGDAHALPFADDSFDAARSERVFQHLAEPAVALAEMRRVTRPGGRVVVTDPDWDTLVIDFPEDVALERRISRVRTDLVARNGRIGRELPRLFRDAGFADLDVIPAAVYLSDYRVANEGCELEYSAELARKAGVVSGAEAETWVDGLRRLAASGQFWCAVMVFIVAGRRV
jgi:SAM-dependent methyltransferase